MSRRFESEKFKFYLLGSSNDLRANKWEATCKACLKRHEPATSMLRHVSITCPKCGQHEVVDFNNLKEA